MKKILIVDDDPEECKRLETYLRGKGYRPFSALTGVEGLELVERQVPEIILLDKELPDIDGITLLGRIKRTLKDCYVIIITVHQDMQFIVRAMQLGAYEYIPKPIRLEELGIIIDKIIENQSLNSKLAHLLISVSQDYKVSSIVGKSRTMQEVFKTIGIVSNTKATVLIQGESGTGKERIAKAIHYNGLDSAKPFVSVNCAALVETLLESELFGHEKGSFTGAVSRKEGRFEYARDGTIFLDEISAMSPNLQGKLLRVLQEKEFERVGGNETVKTDARVMAATNRDLEYLVKQGQFRDDLYYRLKVVHISVPALRERTEDVPLLAYHFLQKHNQKTAKNIQQISDMAMNLLVAYSWPGNVRELENTIERAVIFCKENFISESELPKEIIKGESKATSLPALKGKSLYKAISIIEKEIILQALEDTSWNKTETAKRLGIHRTTLLSKLKRHQLTDQENLEL